MKHILNTLIYNHTKRFVYVCVLLYKL